MTNDFDKLNHIKSLHRKKMLANYLSKVLFWLQSNKNIRKGGKMEKLFTSTLFAVVFVFTFSTCGA